MSALLGGSFLVVVLPFITLKMLATPPGLQSFCWEICWYPQGVPLCVTCYCSFVAFNIFSLPLIFANLITTGPDMFLLGFILPGTLCTLWTWVFLFSCYGYSRLSHLKILSRVHSLFSVWMLVPSVLFQRSLSSFPFPYSAPRQGFPAFCVPAHFIWSSSSLILVWSPLVYFSLQVLFICLFSLYFFWVFVKHFLHLFCIPSILLLNSWVIFTIIILSSFYGRLPVTASVSRRSGVPAPSFLWEHSFDVSFCLSFLWLSFLFHGLQNCHSCFCRLFPGGWG